MAETDVLAQADDSLMDMDYGKELLPVKTEIQLPRLRERIGTFGAMGTGKSWQWLKIAELLLPAGIKFKCIDTDEAIPYMLSTQFPHLLPENGGNVFVQQVWDWKTYKAGAKWSKIGMRPIDWIVVDMVDEAWKKSQNHFISEVYDEEMGDYFLAVRKAVEEANKQIRAARAAWKPKPGESSRPPKEISALMTEVFDGWLDWPVINRLYDDWFEPLLHSVPNLYMTAKVQEIGKKDPAEVKIAFGHLGVRPAGQKNLGHKTHCWFLLSTNADVEGNIHWLITTAKDRADRPYFRRTRLSSFYMQYMVAKANWPVLIG